MEVKDIVQDEKQKEQELAERREKYKITQKYLLTKEFRELLDLFKNKWEILLRKAKTELKTREKPVQEHSELDKIEQFRLLLQEVVKRLWKTQWDNIFKEELERQIEYAESNIYWKVTNMETWEMFDVPIYTKLDLIKQLRIDSILLDKRFYNISEWFHDEKEVKDEANPYV